MPAPAEAPGAERELRFMLADMARFAAASGDHSPLHMDPDFARRTAFGERIIHGGLLTLAMLGLIPADELAEVRAIRSTFPGPVLPEQPCLARARRRPGHRAEWEIRLSARGKLLARVATSPRAEPPAGFDAAALAAERPEVIAKPYRPGPELQELARDHGLQQLDPGLLSGVAWASHVVGMSIPDFDGLCAAVTLVTAQPSAADPAGPRVRVRERDRRTGRMVIDGRFDSPAGIVGVIECFPFSPTPLSEAAALTEPMPAEERGTVVVVGGSRGLGGTLALACLARGYRVHALYSASESAAEHLRHLAGSSASRLQLHRLDAADPDAVAALARELPAGLDGLALCAAPPDLPMAIGASGELERHVADSLALAATPLAALAAGLSRAGGWVLFCSSAAPDRELPQLAAAKAALEGVAGWLAATAPSLRVAVARLPKLRTDRANTPAARATALAPEAVAADLLERLHEEAWAPGAHLIALEPEPALS